MLPGKPACELGSFWPEDCSSGRHFANQNRKFKLSQVQVGGIMAAWNFEDWWSVESMSTRQHVTGRSFGTLHQLVLLITAFTPHA